MSGTLSKEYFWLCSGSFQRPGRDDGDAARGQDGRGRLPGEAEEHGPEVEAEVRSARRNVQQKKRSQAAPRSGEFRIHLSLIS